MHKRPQQAWSTNIFLLFKRCKDYFDPQLICKTFVQRKLARYWVYCLCTCPLVRLLRQWWVLDYFPLPLDRSWVKRWVNHQNTRTKTLPKPPTPLERYQHFIQLIVFSLFGTKYSNKWRRTKCFCLFRKNAGEIFSLSRSKGKCDYTLWESPWKVIGQSNEGNFMTHFEEGYRNQQKGCRILVRYACW